MTFFGKRRHNVLLDQQAHIRSLDREKQKRKKLTTVFLRFFIAALILLFLFGLLIKVPEIYAKIARPFTNLQTEFYQNSKINFEKRTNILLINFRAGELTDLALASYETGKKKVEVLKIPPATFVYGQNEPKLVRDLVVYKSRQPVNIDQLSAAVVEVIGYVPTGYILTKDSPDWINLEKLNELVKKTSLSPAFFLDFKSRKDYLDNHLVTNLTMAEFYQMTQTVKKVLPDRFDVIDLKKFQTAEGYIDQRALVNEIGVKMNDSQIVEANYAVEIVNASGVDGLGLITKNILNNLGANVVSISSADDLVPKSQLLSKDKRNYLVSRLSDIFPGISKEENLGSIDLRIIVGKDFGKFFAY